MAPRLPYRLQQVLRVATSGNAAPPEIPADAQARLNEPMLHQFRILPVVDQQHLLRVYQSLVDLGAEDDTITAGLMHDVGKACAKCRITVIDRGLHVLLSRIAPWSYRRFARIEVAPAFIRGLHRLANHADRGALAASQAGYNERIVDLVRHHERGGDATDTQLQLLRQADDSAERQ